MGWARLAQSPGNGRALRNLLVRILGEGDLRAEVERIMGEGRHTLRDDDALDEKGAAKARTEANKARDAADGRLDEARRALASLDGALPDAPTADEVESAAEIRARLAVWTAHDSAAERHARAVADVETKREAAARWTAAVKALGLRPAVDAEAIKEAARVLLEARRALTDARQAESRALDRVAAAGRAEKEAEGAVSDEALGVADLLVKQQRDALAAAEAKAGPLGSVPCRGLRATVYGSGSDEEVNDGDRVDCGTCHYLTDARAAADALPGLRDNVTQAERAATEASRGFPARRAKAADLAAAEYRAAQEGASRAATARAKAEEAERAAVDADSRARTAGDGATKWDEQKKALGAEPVKPAAPPVAPVAPTSERPSEDDAAWAASVALRVTEAAGAAAERARAKAAAERGVTDRGAEALRATAWAARADALVEAVRVAPTAIARRQAEALGDMGPVSIVFLDDGGVDVRFTDERGPRSWSACSTGEQVVIGVYVQAALRRAAKLLYLPIWIDRVQDYSGRIPEVAAPTVRLVTADEDLCVAADAALAAK